ncbi:sugar metabolism transcriptional regulator [Pleurocapsa sp. CCALA 161]|uniref:FeoC-like transcriptional regulator n=1 Tax=Pleurocapsa sp. CCALA 161 TaxID=2107688 RepID=UPI000D05CD98|nr:FeoC-like transcriptional regulator [Pleurocapsa sp. CCALA 161]PSB09229.1 sugar metabolism transcriptional regulator [Pleurocapsa sp. CCALA 161]
MKLKELQDFVYNFRRVSLAEMKLYLQIDGETLRLMLNGLITQGIVQKSPTTPECKTCQKCEAEEIEFYEWVEST